MRKNAKLWGLLLMVALAASTASAFAQQAAPAAPAAGQAAGNQLAIGAQDVITDSDTGGGYLTNRDILLIVLIVLAVFGLAAIL